MHALKNANMADPLTITLWVAWWIIMSSYLDDGLINGICCYGTVNSSCFIKI